MYAIVEIQGQQFKAEAGKKLFVHYLGDEKNEGLFEAEQHAERFQPQRHACAVCADQVAEQEGGEAACRYLY